MLSSNHKYKCIPRVVALEDDFIISFVKPPHPSSSHADIEMKFTKVSSYMLILRHIFVALFCLLECLRRKVAGRESQSFAFSRTVVLFIN